MGPILTRFRHKRDIPEVAFTLVDWVKNPPAPIAKLEPGRALSMPLEEDVILPAAHPKENFAEQRKVLDMIRVDGDGGS